MRDKILMRMMISIAVILTMAMLPIGHMVGADEVDISFPDIDGTITSDQTWSGTQTFGEVTIQAGVTVTVSPGAVLKNHHTASFIEVEGYLSAIGTEASPIELGDMGSNWINIETKDSGSLRMENCSIYKGANNLLLGGAPSYIKNVTTVGGSHGIQITSEGNTLIGCTTLDATFGIYLFMVSNGMEIIDCHIENCDYGILMYDSMYINITTTTLVNIDVWGIYIWASKSIHVDSCTINDGGSYAVLLDDVSSNILVENSRLNGSSSGVYISSDNTTIRGCEIDLGEGFGGYAGLYLSSTMEDLLVEDCVVNNCDYGIVIGTNMWSDATFRETSFGPNVEDVLITESLTRRPADQEINVTFEGCSLDGNNSIVQGLYRNSWVEMINSTWNQELEMPFNTSGGEVNISWLLDFKATDGNGDLTPFNLLFESTNGDEMIDIDVNSGYVEDVEIPLWHINDTEEREILYDLTITSLVDPNVKLSESGEGPYGDTLLWIEWDLPPTNSLLDPITLDEDERVTWNLSEYFVDPEGHPIVYEVTAGSNTYFDLDGQFLTFGGVDDFNGETWIEIGGTDEGGNTSFENVTITVLPVNDAPMLSMDLPELVTEEDTSAWINLSGYGEDAEGDTFFWNSSAVQNAALAWDVERINLTVIPDADFFGVIEVELELSDGVNWTNPVLIVNVTPVNDAPTGVVIWPNGTEVGSAVEEVNGVNVTVITVELLEDSSISFSIVGTDVDGDDMLYLPEPIGASLGTLNVEIYTYINETNETVTGTVPYNFTYVPEPDVNGEDIVMFLIHDGLVNGTLYVKFDIIPVNDEPILDMTDPLTVNVDIGVPQTVEISEYVSDVDGVETLTLTISDSEYATVVNLSIILDYPDTYTGSGETLTVTISDGEYTVTGEIVVAVHGDSIDDWEVTNVKVKASEDGWTVTAQGGEGQEVFLVVEDEEGNKESFPMTWDGEQYTAIIEEDDAKEGMQWYVTDTEDGADPNPGTVTSLPKLAQEEDSSGSLMIVIIILLVIVLAFIIAIVAVAMKGKGSSDEDDWGDEE